MDEKLVVAVLGNRNSGKTTTWNSLFGRTVRTGKQMRRLQLREAAWCDVFLVSGSAEERHRYVGEIIGALSPRIVLCSMQYREDVAASIEYFRNTGYSFFAMWLNPGYSDPAAQTDSLSLMPSLLSGGATICIRDGKRAPDHRTQEIRDFIYGWASSRGLVDE